MTEKRLEHLLLQSFMLSHLIPLLFQSFAMAGQQPHFNLRLSRAT